MISILETAAFSAWFATLDDQKLRDKILARIRRLSLGNAGDARSVGGGVLEMRIDYGPGYRVYFVKRGAHLVILLGGGDKRAQHRDIAAAIALADQL